MTQSQSIVLESMRAELQARLAEREPIAVERCPDPVDDMLQYSARDVATLDMKRTRNLLRQVEEALERIRDGSYGICVRCEERIRPGRIVAVPWASLCVKCQELAEAEQEEASPAVACEELA